MGHYDNSREHDRLEKIEAEQQRKRLELHQLVDSLHHHNISAAYAIMINWRQISDMFKAQRAVSKAIEDEPLTW